MQSLTDSVIHVSVAQQMSTDLHIAAGDDDLQEVKRLLSGRADLNLVSVAGLTPLHVAAGEVTTLFRTLEYEQLHSKVHFF